MRKRNFNFVIDKVVWLIILLLPIILYFGQYFAYELTAVTDIGSFTNYLINNFGISTNNPFYTILNDLFGQGGILPYFDGQSALLIYFCYFLIVEITHVLFDVLVFIPRFAHSMIEKFGGAND